MPDRAWRLRSGAATFNLWKGHHAETGWAGIGVTAAALIFMPLLARAKRGLGRSLGSSAMMADAKQTDFCMYQAAIVLFGLLMHTIFKIDWADSVAAFLLVPLLVRAGVLSLQGQHYCSHYPTLAHMCKCWMNSDHEV